MKLLKKVINEAMGRAGYKINRIARDQIIPEIPDANLYRGPEDFARLFRPWLGSNYDEIFSGEILQNTMLSRQKLYFLLKLLRQTLVVPGDIFEAGVGSGGSSRLMLNCLLESKSSRRMWLLDTFEGYQKVNATRDGEHTKVNQCKCKSKEEVRQLLNNSDIEINLIKGLIPETLEQVVTKEISFAHIDVNLYEPTLAATDFCLNRLSKGGIILFDDYNWPATYGARQAIDEACARHRLDVICVPESTQAFLIRN